MNQSETTAEPAIQSVTYAPSDGTQQPDFDLGLDWDWDDVNEMDGNDDFVGVIEDEDEEEEEEEEIKAEPTDLPPITPQATPPPSTAEPAIQSVTHAPSDGTLQLDLDDFEVVNETMDGNEVEAESTDLPPHVNHTDVQDLDAKVKSMMTKSQNIVHGRKADKCKSCGKEDTSTNMKFHIEANHLTGVSLPCNYCEKTFKTRNSWGRHKHIHNRSHRSKLRGRSFSSCNYCEKTFRSRQSLRNHIKIHK